MNNIILEGNITPEIQQAFESGLSTTTKYIIIAIIAATVLGLAYKIIDSKLLKFADKIKKKCNKENKGAEILPYEKKYLLTQNEQAFYKKIKPLCDENNLHIIAKVRLADIVEIEKGLDKKQWQAYFNKINKKHIDFVLCNSEDLRIEYLVELDDKSHERADRVKRDNFVNDICKKVDYKLIRVKNADEFKNYLQNDLTAAQS